MDAAAFALALSLTLSLALTLALAVVAVAVGGLLWATFQREEVFQPDGREPDAVSANYAELLLTAHTELPFTRGAATGCPAASLENPSHWFFAVITSMTFCERIAAISSCL